MSGPGTEAGRALLAVLGTLGSTTARLVSAAVLAIEAEAARSAAAPDPALDVERLATAMRNVIDRPGAKRMSVEATAADYAAEYALLGPPPAPSDHGAVDVERLAAALHRIDGGADVDYTYMAETIRDEYAAEYARLAPSVPPEETLT